MFTVDATATTKMQREKLVTIRDMSLKMKKVRILNQKIKRMDIKILELQEKLGSSVVRQELNDTKKALSAMKIKYKRLRTYRKLKKIVFATQTADDRREADLEREVVERDKVIVQLQDENLSLQDRVKELESGVELTKLDGKTYSPEMRMKAYDAIVAGVPTKNIPSLIVKFANRSGTTLTDVPHRSTVEAMVRELGAISDLQAAEALLANRDCTIGFDATTQDGTHLNSVHITTKANCYVIAADELPGGTAEDYHLHICESVDNLAHVCVLPFPGQGLPDHSSRSNFKCFQQHD